MVNWLVTDLSHISIFGQIMASFCHTTKPCDAQTERGLNPYKM